MRFLQAIRLLDKENNVSLTNIALVATGVLLWWSTTLFTALAFIAASANYGFKRWVEYMTPKEAERDERIDQLVEDVEEMQSKINNLNWKVGIGHNER